VELGRLHAELDATMVYVTHDQTEAMTMADRIVVLNGGSIEQIGAPLDLYNRPTNRFVAGFLGSPRMNFIAARAGPSSGRVVSVEVAGLGGSLPLAIEPRAALPVPGDELTIGVRAESLRPGTGGALTFDARVVVVESLGRETLLYVDAAPLEAVDSESAEGYFAVHRPAQVVAGHGERLSITIPAEAVYLFDRDGRTLHNPTLAGVGPPQT
jgi:multiple sugar transport system ATP-binding protein